jgi:hypothetical protein
MSAAAFRELLHSEPRVALALLPQLVMKIRALTTRVYEFSTLAVSNRIQAELLRLASLVPRAGKRARIDPAPTHTDIASRISTHREAVTRELNRLSRSGLIERAAWQAPAGLKLAPLFAATFLAVAALYAAVRRVTVLRFCFGLTPLPADTQGGSS